MDTLGPLLVFIPIYLVLGVVVLAAVWTVPPLLDTAGWLAAEAHCWAWDSRAKPAYWIWLTWSAPAVELPAAATQPPYPERGGDWLLGVLLSELSSQRQEVDALDGKLGVIVAVVAAIVPFLIAATFDDGRMSSSPLELSLGGMSIVLFVAAIMHGLWGLRMRDFHGTPESGVIRGQLLDAQFADNDVVWATITSLERAVVHNQILKRPKLAALRVVWGFVIGGAAVTAGTMLSGLL